MSESEVPETQDEQEVQTTDLGDDEGQDNSPNLPIPPATFEFFIYSMKMQAELHMGLLHFGEDKDRPKPNLPVARHTIDLIAMLGEKTKGNLSMDEQRLIENSLTELRFRYVQAFETAPKNQQ